MRWDWLIMRKALEKAFLDPAGYPGRNRAVSPGLIALRGTPGAELPPRRPLFEADGQGGPNRSGKDSETKSDGDRPAA
jgi:hypothetical protein